MRIVDFQSEPIAVINSDNERTTSIYDVAGQPIAAVDPLGKRSTAVYDAAGNRTTTENHAVRITTIYDDLNRRDDLSTKYKV